MRSFISASTVAFSVCVLAGCQRQAKFEGPTVPAFNGRVVAGGNPVKFPDGEDIFIKVFHEKGQSFNIPIQADGTFNITWMPIGKYSAALMRKQKGGRGGPGRVGIPDFTVVEGQTEYSIELGKSYKP